MKDSRTNALTWSTPARMRRYFKIAILGIIVVAVLILCWHSLSDAIVPVVLTGNKQHNPEIRSSVSRREVSAPKDRLGSIPSSSQSDAVCSIDPPSGEDLVQLSWKFQENGEPPETLRIRVRFLRTKDELDRRLPDPSLVSELELDLRLGESKKVFIPNTADALEPIVVGQDAAVVIEPDKLATWPYCGIVPLIMTKDGVEEIVILIVTCKSIRGVVLDSHTRAPVEDVKLVLYREGISAPIAAVLSDEYGRFDFENIHDGVFGIAIEFEKRFIDVASDICTLAVRSKTEGIDQFLGESAYVDCVLATNPIVVIRSSRDLANAELVIPIGRHASISGTVSEFDGRACSGLTLTFCRLDVHASAREVTTDVNGRFTLESCFPGTYRCTLGGANQKSETSWNVDVESGRDAMLDISLPQRKSVRVVARSMDGRPIESMRFYIHRHTSDFHGSGRLEFPLTDRSGESQLDGILDRAVLVRVVNDESSPWIPKESPESARRIIRFSEREIETVTFEFRAGSRYESDFEFRDLAASLPTEANVSGFMALFSIGEEGPILYRWSGDASGRMRAYFDTNGSPLVIRQVNVNFEGGHFIKCRVKDGTSEVLTSGRLRRIELERY